MTTSRLCTGGLAAALSDLSDADTIEREMNRLAQLITGHDRLRWTFDPSDPDHIIGWWEEKP